MSSAPCSAENAAPSSVLCPRLDAQLARQCRPLVSIAASGHDWPLRGKPWHPNLVADNRCAHVGSGDGRRIPGLAMGWPGDSAAMKLTKVVIAMGLLVGLTIAGHVAVREWYKPHVRSEQGRQAQARQPESRGRQDLGVSVRRTNAGTLIDFGTQRRQALSSPEPSAGQITPRRGETKTPKPERSAFLPILAGLVTGGILTALLLGWRRRRKPKAQPAADRVSGRGQLPLVSPADLEKAELLRGRQELR